MKPYDLNLLRVLDAVLAAGSVSGAAQRLHLSVPATSHALARLREVVGDPLLVRAGRQLLPTPRALELREPVAQWMALAQALVARAKAPTLAAVQRSFVVRAPEGVAIAHGAALAQALRQEMPRSTLAFVPETLDDPTALREGRVDLDIGYFSPREPEVERVELLRQRQVAVVRRGHQLATRPLTARRYAAAAHVAVQRRRGTPSPVDDALAALGLARDIVLTVPQANVSAIIAARSELVATLSERVAAAMAGGLGLQLLPLAFAATPETMLMAWHPRQSVDPAHTWLRQRVLGLSAESAGRAPRAT
jgi:DNA-binding transcriptional LysR family regulator